jgi:predicted nucleic acid-binding protein
MGCQACRPWQNQIFPCTVSPSPVWISIIALAEVEYGLKTAPKMLVQRQKDVRIEMAKYPEVLESDKHTVVPYSDLRAELFRLMHL